MQIRVLAFISIFVAGATHADPAQDASAEIARCAGIGDSAARLKCFDAAASRANGAAGQPAGEAPGRAEGFGFSAPETVTREEDCGKPPPRKPMKVAIETGLLDSYNLTIEGRNALIRVRRLK